MIIQNTESDINVAFSYLNNYPDPFVSESEKLTNESNIKNTMDYFANMAFSQYWENRSTIVPNYKLLNGIIDESHFYSNDSYDQPAVKDFLQTLKAGSDPLPEHVKHYSILNPVINALLGELSKRPDIHRVRAFDDASRSEELEYKTEIVQQLILQEAKNIILNKLAIQGASPDDVSDEDLQNMTFENAKDLLTDFTSIGEQWGNKMLTALKAEFNIKEKSEEAFRDLTTCSREFYEIYEDSSKTGFNVRAVNPKNVWWKGTADTKYMSGVSGESSVPYCLGTIHVKEISEIILEFPEITKEEIDHLKLAMQNSLLMRGKESNLFSDKTGINTIHYQTYNPLIYQERMVEQSLFGNEFKDNLTHFLGGSNAFSFGYKYVVIKAYWHSKKKVGRLIYTDEDGNPQSTLVDESYKKSPNEISIEWGWVNQWYQGTKIGPDIYFVKPFDLLDYSPIIGMIYQGKNAPPMSLVDQMKPLQAMFNVCMNQLWELFEKEIGNVGVINIRRIPRPKDGDAADAIDAWMDKAREFGYVFDDDSLENTKGQTQNQTTARSMDLTRTAEITSRLNTAVQLQEMCWQLVGMNRQRLGAPLATETATANQNALVQSFAQTEPWFAAHSYVLNQLYQGVLDAAQFIESNKPESTLSYVNASGYGEFLKVMGEDLRLRDLKVFVTSKAEDQQLFNEFRQLAQAMLQNGASIYEVSQLYVTNSLREMQKAFKDSAQKRDGQMQQAQQLEQDKVQQEAETAQAQLQLQEKEHDDNLAMKKYEIDVKANTDLAKAQISTFFQAPSTDADGNGTPDIMEIAAHQLKLQDQIDRRDLQHQQLNLEQMKFMADQKQKSVDNKLANEKLKNDREKLKIQRKAANKKPAAPKKK